jgi:hypothetical protein
MLRTAIRGAARGADVVVFRPMGGAVALTRRVAEDALRDLAERVLTRTLSGDMVDLLARDLVRYRVIERVSDRVLDGEAIDRIVDRADAAGVPQRIAERLLDDGIAEQVAERVLAGPELERIVALTLESEPVREAIAASLESPGAEHLLALALESPGAERLLALALESPGMERMVKQVVESRVVEETVARMVDETAERLPRSPALWGLVDEIVASPTVTDAITQQGVGFADDVADAVRERSRTADERLEKAAWRLLRRRKGGLPTGGPSASGAT